MKMNKEELFDFVINQNKNLINEPVVCLEEWMKKARISVRDLSVLLGKDRSYVYKTFSGTITPPKKVMDHIKVITAGKIREEYQLISTF